MRYARKLIPATTGIVLAASACGTADGANWAGAIRDSAGVQIVENPATGLWTGDEAWELVEELRIGTSEGEADYQFGQIAAVAVVGSGDIYVLDQQGQHIKVFDSRGQFLRTIGSAGSGPGQLSAQTQSLVRGRGDTLLVLDAGNARFNKYLSDGTPAGSERVDFAAGFPIRIESTTDGDLVVQFRRFAFPGAPDGDNLDHLVRIRSGGAPAEIAVQPSPEGPGEARPQSRDTLLSFPQGGTFTAAGGQPRWEFFSPEPIWDLRPDGHLLFAVNNAYRISVVDTAGAVVRVITRPFEPTPVTEADQTDMRNTILDMMVRQMPQRPTSDQLTQFRSAMHFAPHYPAFALIVAGPRETLWVQHLQTPDQLSPEERENFNIQMDLAAPRWDVFDGEGRFLGMVNMPGRIQVLAIDGDVFYGVMRDELDVQYVVRLRLERPGA